jgi:hypothetical protein
MIEQWMEEMASTDSEIVKARDQFRLRLVQAERLSLDLQDPDKQEELANTPPHLVGRR